MEEKESIFEDIKGEEIQVSSLHAVTANLIDWGIEVFIIIAFYFFFPRQILINLFEINSYIKYIIVLFLIFFYRLITILAFGKTIGMMVARIKYLNGDLLPLTQKEKSIAIFATRTASIRYYIN